MPRYRMKDGVGIHNVTMADGSVKTIHPGDEEKLEPWQIANAMDKFIALDPPPPEPMPNIGLELVPRGGGWYDLVNVKSGKNLNDEPMRRADAIALAWKIAGEDEKNGEQTGDDTNDQGTEQAKASGAGTED